MAGADVTGKVTARLVDVPLMKAMELVLRENGYALAREDSIYRVLPLKVAEELGLATSTETFKLEYAKASDVAAVLKDIVTAKGKVVASDSANVVIVSDFPDNMRKVADVIRELDVAQTIIATTTGTFRLSYLEAMPTAKILEKMVGENGSIIADQTTNSIILTETPGSFQVISDLISELDHKPGQVYISVLMVDAVLSDDSEFGVDWLAKAFKEGSVNQGVRQADFDTTLGNVGTEALNAGVMTLGVLSGRFDLQATIAAEVQSRDATILADPRILVVNNETAKIEIVTEVPFQEITQSTQGPPVASTEFKDIGVMLDVTPRITHEDTVLLRLRPEESSITGYTDSGIPIEDSRRADTTILLNDGQTVVVGGLRNISHSRTVTRVPWLSEIPVLGALFRNTITKRANTELLVFLTVHIVKDAPPELTAHERAKFDQIELEPKVPDGTRELWDDIRHPWGKREPIWKRQERVR
jgi:general secretion pathway protein D